MITKELTKRSTAEAKQTKAKAKEAKAKEAKQITNTKLRSESGFTSTRKNEYNKHTSTNTADKRTKPLGDYSPSGFGETGLVGGKSRFSISA